MKILICNFFCLLTNFYLTDLEYSYNQITLNETTL